MSKVYRLPLSIEDKLDLTIKELSHSIVDKLDLIIKILTLREIELAMKDYIYKDLIKELVEYLE
jgi:hypothetical protein